jgi:hypothetical protein
LRGLIGCHVRVKHGLEFFEEAEDLLEYLQLLLNAVKSLICTDLQTESQRSNAEDILIDFLIKKDL